MAAPDASSPDPSLFRIKDIPLDTLAANKFLESALDKRRKKFNREVRKLYEGAINSHYRRRVNKRSADLPAWDIFVRPRLFFDLQCPACARVFRVDYYQGGFDDQNRMACPGCGAVGGLSARAVMNVFKAKLREAQAAAGDDDLFANARLGRIIANAVLLLEPVAMVFICHPLMSMGLGHYLLHPAIFIGRITKCLGPDFLMIMARPKPELTSNSYVFEQWARVALELPAAEEAAARLRGLSGHRDYNPAVNMTRKLWSFRRSGDRSPATPLKEETLPVHARHWVDLLSYSESWMTDPDNEVAAVAPLFSFTLREHRAADDWRREHGLPENYVTFLARDTAHSDTVDPQGQLALYHRYRDVEAETYIAAMQWLAERGTGSLRMGKVVRQPLRLKAPGIVDYASLPDRNDFLDIYFFAHSAFTVTCGSGPDAVAKLMDAPLLVANSIPLVAALMTFNYQKAVVSFKPMWNKNAGRIVSCREILANGWTLLDNTEDYRDRGLEPSAHTLEEMRAMVEEMYARFVTGTWVVTEKETLMQEKFKSLLAEFFPGFIWQGHLAFSYYSAHPEFLAGA